MKTTIKQIVKPENGIEAAIVSDANFIQGASYGKPRSGHPEGKVIYHIKEVLENIDKFYSEHSDRTDLRFIALIHDTFKHKVDRNKPKTGDNHHGTIARVFAQQYTQDPKILRIIELHDEAYNAWSVGGRRGNWYKAEERATKLLDELRLIGGLGLYINFYRCDNATGDKEQDNYEWFWNLMVIKSA